MTGKDLKNSILQLAIQGKLVPQDANDEPASELLKRIRKEKEQLVKDGKLKKKDLVTMPISDEEKLFEIPESWEWCRLGEIVKNRDSERIPLSVSVRSTQHRKIYDYYGPGGAFDKVEDYLFDKRLLLIGEDGANLLTRSKPNAFFADGKYWVNNHVHVLDSYIEEGIMLDYIAMRINGMSLADYVTGTAQPKMNQEKMNTIIIPLPPLSEQQRIVAKIEELMPLVDEYDKAQTQLDELNAKLPEALKKSILQEAIMGKLVPQDPKDEPASELLKRIRKEKEQLVKYGKLKKKDLVTTPISDEEKPFEIPESWEWCRLGDVISLLSGQDLTPDRYFDTKCGIPYITGASHFVDGGLIISRWTETPTSISHKGDLLITCKGTVGTMAYNTIGDIHIARQVMAIYGYFISLQYIRYFLELVVPVLEKQAHSIIPGISREVVLNTALPLPPLAEQRRIVAKLEEILPKIDSIRQ